MSASSFAENPQVQLISDRSRQLVAALRKVPVKYWQNAMYVAAVVWVCHSLASLVWVAIGAPELEQPAKLAAPAAAAPQSSTKSVDLAGLQKSEIFGKLGAAPLPAPEPEPVGDFDDAKTTKLNVKLQGVIASNDPKKGGAIIEEGSKQGFYSVGEELKQNRGVKLAKVMDQRVILDNRGTPESLWLYSEADFKKSKVAGGPKRMSVPRTKPKTRKVGSDISEENTTRSTLRPEQLPKSVGDVVRFSVHREGGKMVGYRIRPGKEAELFTQLGLKTNDIVISVNGIDVDDPKKIRSVYKEVKTAPEAQLTVLRDGQTFSINISLDSDG